jgi:ketosteroid isomerase-like protein
MKWNIYSLVFAIIALAGGASPSPFASPQDQIRAVLESQQDAWNRGDLDAFMQGYWKSDRTEFVGASGIQRSWQAVLDRYRQRYPDRTAMGKLTFSNLEITMLGPKAAFVLGEWWLDRASDQPHGVFTLIFRKFPEGWRIIHDHTSAAQK